MVRPTQANFMTHDYTAFSGHVDETLVHEIIQRGLNQTMSTRVVGQSFSWFKERSQVK